MKFCTICTSNRGYIRGYKDFCVNGLGSYQTGTLSFEPPRVYRRVIILRGLVDLVLPVPADWRAGTETGPYDVGCMRRIFSSIKSVTVSGIR